MLVFHVSQHVQTSGMYFQYALTLILNGLISVLSMFLPTPFFMLASFWHRIGNQEMAFERNQNLISGDYVYIHFQSGHDLVQ